MIRRLVGIGKIDLYALFLGKFVRAGDSFVVRHKAQNTADQSFIRAVSASGFGKGAVERKMHAADLRP